MTHIDLVLVWFQRLEASHIDLPIICDVVMGALERSVDGDGCFLDDILGTNKMFLNTLFNISFGQG